jgi:hypothetical protein
MEVYLLVMVLTGAMSMDQLFGLMIATLKVGLLQWLKIWWIKLVMKCREDKGTLFDPILTMVRK